MSTEPDDPADFIGVCDYCGMPIYRVGQACPAQEAGVCKI